MATPAATSRLPRTLRLPRFATVALVVIAALALTLRASTDPVLERVRSRYNPSATIEAEIDMTIWWEVREREEKQSGRLLLAAGDRFDVQLGDSRWVCDGRTLWHYSAAANQVVIRRLLDVDLSSHPSQILSTYLMDYEYREQSRKGKHRVLAWESDGDNPDGKYASIGMTVDEASGIVQSLAVVDTRGNRSTWTFRKTRFDPPLDPAPFTFTPPEGTHVVDTRE